MGTSPPESSPTSSRSRAGALLTAATLTLGTLGLAGCGGSDGGDGGDGSPSPSPTSASASPSATPSESPTAEPTTSRVYYLVDTRTGFRLAREVRDLSGADPARESVEAMIAGAEDPDYGTTWNPDTRVLGVSRKGKTITVDLSAEARTANAGSAVAALMIQQLVWTVTEVLGPRAKVQLLIEGKPAGELWGAVSWDRPIAREAATDVRTLVQIETPREGATSPSPLTVSGDANVFEANVPWRVLDSAGKVVKSGAAMTSEGMVFAPFTFTVDLDPGTYVVEISEDDPSGGEGGTPMTDTRTVTIQ